MKTTMNVQFGQELTESENLMTGLRVKSAVKSGALDACHKHSMKPASGLRVKSAVKGGALDAC